MEATEKLDCKCSKTCNSSLMKSSSIIQHDNNRLGQLADDQLYFEDARQFMNLAQNDPDQHALFDFKVFYVIVSALFLFVLISCFLPSCFISTKCRPV